jgi:hypothetical protein
MFATGLPFWMSFTQYRYKVFTSMTTKKPYTSPKAELIKALKKILKTKETSNEVRECINEQLSIIKESSKDSEIIQNYCIGEII